MFLVGFSGTRNVRPQLLSCSVRLSVEPYMPVGFTYFLQVMSPGLLD